MALPELTPNFSSPATSFDSVIEEPKGTSQLVSGQRAPVIVTPKSAVNPITLKTDLIGNVKS